LLNAAAAIAAFEGDMEIDVKERLTMGLERAVHAVDSGAALDLLEKWAALTQQISASS
jgi:anthranilate phosphoribosyltransferase